jgi:CheY-like chemotaxis protein
LPVRALTAHSPKGEEKKFLAAEFDSDVSEPPEVKNLTAEVRRVLKLKHAADGLGA